MSKLQQNALLNFHKNKKNESMCSADELKKMISENTAMLGDHSTMLEDHITETKGKFESFLDALTRISHQSEKTASDFHEHKIWEEGYRKRQEADHNNIVEQISTISSTQKTLAETQSKLAEGNDIILDFVSKKNALLSLGSGVKDIALWIVALGSCGTLLLSWFGG